MTASSIHPYHLFLICASISVFTLILKGGEIFDVPDLPKNLESFLKSAGDHLSSKYLLVDPSEGLVEKEYAGKDRGAALSSHLSIPLQNLRPSEVSLTLTKIYSPTSIQPAQELVAIQNDPLPTEIAKPLDMGDSIGTKEVAETISEEHILKLDKNVSGTYLMATNALSTSLELDTFRDSDSSYAKQTIPITSNTYFVPELALPADSPCFVPNHNRTDALVALNRTLPRPILNLGMPKCGSTTLAEFFRCAGMKTNHWMTNRHGYIGLCMRKAIERGNPPIAACDSWLNARTRRGKKNRPNASVDSGAEAFLELDVVNEPDKCVFPQMSYLNELHEEAPNATFILNFRDVVDWVKSVSRWKGIGLLLSDRLAACDLPGLPVGKGNSTRDLSRWLCWHVENVRKFVKDHPSHALIELDLYATERNADVMSSLFRAKRSCWGHANSNPRRLRE